MGGAGSVNGRTALLVDDDDQLRTFGWGYFRTTDNRQENQMVSRIRCVAGGGSGPGYGNNPGFCDQLRCLDWANLAWCRKMVCESFFRRLIRSFLFSCCMVCKRF